MVTFTRRNFSLGAATVAVVGFAPPAARAADFEVTHSDEEWRRRLTAEQYAVLRKSKTERAGTSALDAEKRVGTFHCVGCDLPLYSSATKYDSGTGWPSFWQPLDNAVATKQETFLLMTQTEVHCRRCGGHLGHVFSDGPKPTGLRYCMNGVAMTFKPGATRS